MYVTMLQDWMRGGKVKTIAHRNREPIALFAGVTAHAAEHTAEKWINDGVARPATPEEIAALDE